MSSGTAKSPIPKAFGTRYGSGFPRSGLSVSVVYIVERDLLPATAR